jgi:hypothetical protein
LLTDLPKFNPVSCSRSLDPGVPNDHIQPNVIETKP